MTKAHRLLAALLLAAAAVFGVASAQDNPAPSPNTKAAKAKPKAKKAKATESEAKPKNTEVKSKRKPKSKEAKEAESKPKAARTKESKSKGAKAKAANSKESKETQAKDVKGAPVPPVTSGVINTAAPARAVPTLALAGSSSTDPADVEATKHAFNHARAGRIAQATEAQRAIKDPVARKLVEWAILRTDGGNAGLARYITFIDDNPDWLTSNALRRRAETLIWNEELSPTATRAYFSRHPPLTGKGRLALARALLAGGDKAGALAHVRAAWQNDAFSGDLESRALELFPGMITAEDNRARLELLLFSNDIEGGLRNANRLGGNAPALARAAAAALRGKGAVPKGVLDAVPAAARKDPLYLFAAAVAQRKAKKFAEAADFMLQAPRDYGPTALGDHWWVEGRLVIRGLLDANDAKKAYRVARDAPIPRKDIYRSDNQFSAGWIALRFVNDAKTAQEHFAQAAKATDTPVHISRAQYWHGRALEALGRKAEARTLYLAAAQHGTAYYGQIANARAGQHEIVLRQPPAAPARPYEIARAIELLYAIGQRDLVVGILAEAGERLNDAAALAAMAEVAIRNDDARAAVLLGKAAVARGLPLDLYAFPTIGLPNYTAVGPPVEKALIYAIARQESTFTNRIVSPARAKGLMQMTPGTGRLIAKRYNVPWNEGKLLSDPAYNVQLGAAELGTLMTDFRGSFILTFVGYNAGRGRVRDWTGKYGDPRETRIDPVDWVERIPIAETRFYIQRVMENMQVYRARFGGGTKLTIEADMRRGGAAATN